MELPAGLPTSAYLGAWLVLALLLAWAALRSPWTRLGVNEQSHVYLGTLVAIALLWTISGRVGPLIHFHLLGATVLYLMFGLPLAILGMTLVAVATNVAAGADWWPVAGRALVAGVLPVLVSHLALRTAEARLPANFFSYVFGAAFLGGALAMLGAAVAVATVAGTIDPAPPAGASPGDAWTAIALMLAFAEATLTGMLITLFVVYKPTWVGTFRDEVYLKRRDP